MTNKDCPRYKKCRQEWAEAKYRESVVFTCHNCIRKEKEAENEQMGNILL